MSFEEMCYLPSHLTTAFPVDGIQSLPINTGLVYIISPVLQVSLPKPSGGIQQPHHIVLSQTIPHISSVGRTRLGHSFLLLGLTEITHAHSARGYVGPEGPQPCPAPCCGCLES